MYKKGFIDFLSERFYWVRTFGLLNGRTNEQFCYDEAVDAVNHIFNGECTRAVVPENRRLLLDSEISDYVSGHFFRCVKTFLSWLKKGETYWFEYKGNGKYEVRSDNNLGNSFEMTVHQLLTCFIPCECEKNVYTSMQYFHWLGELGIHHGYVDEMIDAYKKF